MNRYFLLITAALIATPALAENSLMDFGKNALESSLGGGNASKGAGMSDSEIASGLKEALKVGTQKAVATVGKPGGFLNDKQVHIPLPGPLGKIKSSLALVGASSVGDDLETRINKAAETAAPKATKIFADAVSKMSIKDARGILTGPSDSATQYFKRTTTPELSAAMKPVIEKSLSDVGAVQSYNNFTAQARALPLGGKVDLDLNDYVVGKTLDGIFLYLGKQEADIRNNPAARTTELLKSVFK